MGDIAWIYAWLKDKNLSFGKVLRTGIDRLIVLKSF